jgi:molybdenum-dependent DNA-binding transcriptional regulator ModE
MARTVFPSSFYCDCGQKSYFFENTVSEMEKMSRTKLVTLRDGGDNEHTIVFLRARRQRLFALNSELAQ